MDKVCNHIRFSEKEIDLIARFVFAQLESNGDLRRVRLNIKLFNNPATRDTISLNLPLFAEDEDGTILDFLISDDFTPEELLRISEVKEKIKQIINHCERSWFIGKRDLEILKMRFGINADEQSMTLEEIGKIFNLTRERVRQIEYSTIRKMKAFFRRKNLVQSDFI